LEKFRKKEIDVLINVDLFGEGFDVPGVEVVIMGRRTASFVVYSQQFGRMLRPVYHPDMPQGTAEERKAAIAAGPKPFATLVDHVGNVPVHMLPTARRGFDLEARPSRSRNMVPVEDRIKVCNNAQCCRPYEAFRTECPFCGHVPEVSGRETSVEAVEGDLLLLPPDIIERMYEETERALSPPRIPYGALPVVENSLRKTHREKLESLAALKDTIAQWGRYEKQKGLNIRESQKLF